MTAHRREPGSACGRRAARWLGGVLSLLAWMFSAGACAQAQDLSPEELEVLVARIALYPDDLVAIILPAATNPLQLVQADRYLEARKSKKDLPVDEKWDDAVKALLNYPEVVKTMSGDLDWTVALGEAVVEDQGEVLDAIQTFRRKTRAAGNLRSDDKQVVTVEKEVITIVPSNPEVIYVPQYNPSTVVVAGGYASWGYYPAPYPVYYYPYPPGAAFATGLIWGAALGAAWNGGHYYAHYGGGSANINIDRSRTTNIDRSQRTTQLPAGGGSSGSPTSSRDRSPAASAGRRRVTRARAVPTSVQRGLAPRRSPPAVRATVRAGQARQARASATSAVARPARTAPARVRAAAHSIAVRPHTRRAWTARAGRRAARRPRAREPAAAGVRAEVAAGAAGGARRKP